MTRYLQNILFLFCLLLVISCSDEEAKTQNGLASRPAIPSVVNNEIQIGTQIWMTKNLNVSRYRNGDIIPQVTDPLQWANLTTGARCYYDNDPTNQTKYGKLYNWYAVTDPRGLAPVGWHIPSYTEWTTLTTFLGGSDIAGGKMKSTGTRESGTGLWFSPNYGATNSSGFTGLPGGWRGYQGAFDNYLANAGSWWSVTPYITLEGAAWSLELQNDFSYAYCYVYYKKNGASVRCIKD